MKSSRLVKVTVTVAKAIDPEVREVVKAMAHAAAVRTLWFEKELTTQEAAQEVGLSDDDCSDWLAGKEMPIGPEPPSHKRVRQWSESVKVETRDLSYYNRLIPGWKPNAPADQEQKQHHDENA